MSIVLTVLCFTAIVAAAVYFVVRTALRARITDEGDIPDPLEDYVRTARASYTDTRDGVTRVVRGGRVGDDPARFRFHGNRG